MGPSVDRGNGPEGTECRVVGVRTGIDGENGNGEVK